MSPLDQGLIDMMLDEITLEPATGVDGYSKYTYGAPVTVRCQIVRMHRKVITRTGDEATSNVQCILADPDVQISLNDRLTLPERYIGEPVTDRQPEILEVLGAKDDVGPYWLEVRA